jgi:hypothetical protein
MTGVGMSFGQLTNAAKGLQESGVFGEAAKLSKNLPGWIGLATTAAITLGTVAYKAADNAIITEDEHAENL